jgi:hypothetical protein
MEQSQLVKLILQSFEERGTALFRRLYHNEIQKRDEAEQGDVSLCRHFARLFNGDAALMDAAYRTSARFDPVVWDQFELFSGMTYGARVIDCAIGKRPERQNFVQGYCGRKPLAQARFRS